MSIVHVDRHKIGKVIQRRIITQMVANDGLHGRRHEEVLLLQTEHLAFHVVIRRIKHLGDGLGKRLVLGCFQIFALIEQMHIKIHRGLCAPQPDAVHRIGIVARNVHIVSKSKDGSIVFEFHFEVAVRPGFFHPAAEMHFKGFFGTGREPHVTLFQPTVGHFHLPTVHDLLLENAVIVLNGETASGIPFRGKRVHIGRRQTAQTAVSEARIRLDLFDLFQIVSEGLQSRRHLVGKPDIEKVIFQRSAGQKLHGHIKHLLVFPFMDLVFELHALTGKDVPHHHTDRFIHLCLGGVLCKDTLLSCHLFFE